MMRRLGTVLLSVTVIFCAVAPAHPAFADPLVDAQLRAQQEQAKIDAANNKIAQDKAVQAQAQAQLNTLNVEIAAAEAQLGQENAKLDSITGKIDQALRDLAAKKADEAQRKDLLNRRMRALYKENGSTNLMDVVLTARTFSELVDRFMVMRDIARSDEVLLQQIQQDKAAIEALNADLNQKREAQAATVNRIQAERAALNEKYVAQRNLQLQAASDQASQEAVNRSATAALAQANAEVASLAAARGRAHSSGIFAWPGVQGPITQGFGCTDLRGEPSPPPGYSCPPSRRYFHAGIDIAGPYGAEIDATDGGIAYTYAGNSGYGNHVIIIHQNGFASLYGHMSGFAIGDGVGVAKGQRIGYEGSTGFSTGAHLHFEIRLNNQPVDPCRYVVC
jgi:murein DD-endopeptidase MepM/ murein hydrolase activator NlpD